MEAAASTRLGLNKMQMPNFLMSSKQIEFKKERLVQLGKEGINEIKDLAEFNKDIWKQIAENIKRLGGADEESGQGRQYEPCHGPSNPISVWGKNTEKTP
eukprot:2828131-Ditylum_brightwellii.AAC.1